MGGSQEEHKHQPFKNGSHYTNPSMSTNQLVERDVLVSTLRYLLHGGKFGENDSAILASEFR